MTFSDPLGLALAAIAGAAVITALVIVVEGIRNEAAAKARHRDHLLAQAEEMNRNLAAIANRDQPDPAADDTDPFFGLAIVPRAAR